MNIYLHLEISARELDSKLLLATLAAAKGHQVIISNLSGIINGLKTGVLLPGIYHTKSLTPSKSKIDRHQKIIEGGCKITSIDEETGLGKKRENKFEELRYSDITISQASAVFGWGEDSVENLKKMFPKNSEKIHKTGSPRVDLWKSFFFDYWLNPKGMPRKPFLLVSSNMSALGMKRFDENFKSVKDAGYIERDPNMFKSMFYSTSESYKKTYEFIDAIKHLAKNNNGYDIILRPHPEENIEAWKIFLKDIPNIHVIREDSITVWIKNAFAVMHNGCTTSVETSVSGKPLLTYNPFKMDYSDEFFNSLGYVISSKEELLVAANNLFNSKEIIEENKLDLEFSRKIQKKIFIDDNELAAEKIVKVWETLNDKSLSRKNNWIIFYLLNKIINFLRKGKNILGKLFPNRFNTLRENYKFPPFDQKDIYQRVNRFKNLLGIDTKLECKFFSDRTVLIKKSSNSSNE